jgi:hypothetical protein
MFLVCNRLFSTQRDENRTDRNACYLGEIIPASLRLLKFTSMLITHCSKCSNGSLSLSLGQVAERHWEVMCALISLLSKKSN